MGLDMYLYARLRLGKYCGEHLKNKAEDVRKLFPEMFKSGNLDSVAVEFESGYWRKSNHIHKWFVDNCQEGEDDCRKAYVDRTDLFKLKVVCEKVLAILSEQKPKEVMLKGYDNEKIEHEVFEDTEEIEELLPTKEGFFFGGTGYDKYYKSDIEETIKIINRCLDLPEDWSFEYGSSW